MDTAKYHADRSFDEWSDGCLWVTIFDAQGCEVLRVIVATESGTNGGAADRTAAEDAALGQSRLAKILDSLNNN